jgi:hypothetical protein
MTTRPTTLRDLIDALTDLADHYGDDTEVRLAQQPRWAFEYSIGEVAVANGDDEDDDDDDDGEPAAAAAPVVYIGEGQQLGYLDGAAARALGWSRR